MEQISSRKPIARKEYCCNYCRDKIEKGQRYQRSFWKDGGIAYEWISHLECQFIVNELWDYYGPDYGVDSEDFGEMCHSFCQDFICPACAYWDKAYDECSEDNCYIECFDKIVETLKKKYIKYVPKQPGDWFGKYVLVDREKVIENV